MRLVNALVSRDPGSVLRDLIAAFVLAILVAYCITFGRGKGDDDGDGSGRDD